MPTMHDQGKPTLLDAMTQSHNFKIHLMGVGPDPGPFAQAYNMPAVTYSGYAPLTFTFPEAELNGDGHAQTTAAPQTFTVTPGGAGAAVGGYYVTTGGTDQLIYYERWGGSYAMSYTNPPLTITPRLVLGPCIDEV